MAKTRCLMAPRCNMFQRVNWICTAVDVYYNDIINESVMRSSFEFHVQEGGRSVLGREYQGEWQCSVMGPLGCSKIAILKV